MALTIRTKKKAVTVTVERDGESCTFTGVPLDIKEADKIEKKYERKRRVKGQVLPEFDFMQITIEKAKKIFTGWSDLLDDEGKPIPFDKDLIDDLYLLNSSIVSNAVKQFAEIGRGEVKPDNSEDIEKN